MPKTDTGERVTRWFEEMETHFEAMKQRYMVINKEEWDDIREIMLIGLDTYSSLKNNRHICDILSQEECPVCQEKM